MENNVIKLLHQERRYFLKQQKFHYILFVVFNFILLFDFLVIIFLRSTTLDGYGWSGIIFLFVLISIEAKQYMEFKRLKETVDEFYLSGEYLELNKKI